MHYKGRPTCLFRKLQSYVDLVSGTEYSAVEQGLPTEKVCQGAQKYMHIHRTLISQSSNREEESF